MSEHDVPTGVPDYDYDFEGQSRAVPTATGYSEREHERAMDRLLTDVERAGPVVQTTTLRRWACGKCAVEERSDGAFDLQHPSIFIAATELRDLARAMLAAADALEAK